MKRFLPKKINLDRSLSYFHWLIDENGIIQFTKGKVKDYAYGYAIEDQARALVLSLMLGDDQTTNILLRQITSSISPHGVYMQRSADGILQLKEDDFGEASAQVVWALTEYQHAKNTDKFSAVIDRLVRGIARSIYPRVYSYALLGLASAPLDDFGHRFVQKLVKLYEKNHESGWEWFENKLIYANALLPWSLLITGRLLHNETYIKIGLKTLEFLTRNLIKDGKPIAVGCRGWWAKGQSMALYDQQPIDVSYMILALLAAYKITKKPVYKEQAQFYYSWFGGSNLQNISIIRDDGACFDGLQEAGVNKNAGAESNICYLLASLMLNSTGL